MKKKEKILVAMSGGVDSSVTAALLQEQGYEVTGAFMALAQGDLDDGIKRVSKIASYLSIPLHVVDLARPFGEQVLSYFCRTYQQGRTPNPCVRCNPTVKFGHLLCFADTQGIRRMATGHYVRLSAQADGRVALLKGVDPKKDQSYFLCCLRQEQLQRLHFPLGCTEKTKVYSLAAQLGLSSLHGSESQDVCFLADTTVQEFLEREIGSSAGPGQFITSDGQVLGEHKGIFHYTVGQRRGLGIPDATPYYVLAIDAAKNHVILGKEEELWQSTLRVAKMNWLAGTPPALPDTVTVKIRYRHRGATAHVREDGQGVQICFDVPQRAITPGQFAVLYREDELLGGGEIL